MPLTPSRTPSSDAVVFGEVNSTDPLNNILNPADFALTNLGKDAVSTSGRCSATPPQIARGFVRQAIGFLLEFVDQFDQ